MNRNRFVFAIAMIAVLSGPSLILKDHMPTVSFHTAEAMANSAPVRTSSIGIQASSQGDSINFPLSFFFGDPDGDDLTYSVAPGSDALPSGLTLNTATGAVTGSASPAGTYTMTFRATDPGSLSADTDTFVYTITGSGPICGNNILESGEQCDDGNTVGGDGCSASCQIEVPANNAPVLTASIGNQSSLQGEAVSLPLASFFNDPDGDDLTYSVAPGSDALPSGLNLNTSTGLVSGATSAAGTYSMTFRATDTGSLSVNSNEFTLTITEPAPICGNNILESGEQCDDGNTVGGDGCSASCQIEVPANNAPVLTASIGNQSSLQGEAVSLPLASFFNDPDGDDLTYSVAPGSDALPSGLNLNTSTGLVSGATSAAGTYSMTFRATDTGSLSVNSNEFTLMITEPAPICGNNILESGEQCDDGNTVGGDGCSASCQIEVPANNAPVLTASIGNQSSLQGEAVSLPLASFFNDPDGDDLTYSVAPGSDALPSGLNLNTSTGLVSGATSAAGTYSMTFRATDTGSLSVNSNEFTLMITEPAPICGNNILESGEQCDDGNTVGGDGCSASCQIEVPANNAPVLTASIGNQSSLQGEAVSLPLASFFNDPDGDDLTYSVAPGSDALPSGLNLNTSTGLVSGATSAAGTYSMTFRATDTGSLSVNSNEFTLTITEPAPICGNNILESGEQCDDGNTVGGDGCSASCQIEVPANNAPVLTASIGNQSSLQGEAVSLPLASFFNDPDGDDLTYSVAPGSDALPSGLNLNTSTGLVSGATSAAGTYSMTFRATDTGSLSVNSNEFTLMITEPAPICGNNILESGEQCDDGNTVGGDGCSASCQIEVPANNAPVLTASIGNQSAPQGESINFPLSNFFNDPDGDTLTYSVAPSSDALPSGLSLNATTGSITGTASPAGTYSMAFRATDPGNLSADTDTFIFVITGSGGGSDTTPPVITFTDDVEAGPVLTDSVIVTVTDANPNPSSYMAAGSFDGFCDALSQFNLPFVSGEPIVTPFDDADINGYYICIRAQDNAGNTSYALSAHPFNIVPPAPICGNNQIEAGEQCDDGNTTNGDACSASCQLETPLPICGNNQIEAAEQCDDGNTTNGDQCSASCQVEAPLPICGNNIFEAGEQCEDGNTTNGDGCNTSCQVEGSSAGDTTPPAVIFTDDVSSSPVTSDTIRIVVSDANADTSTYRYGFSSDAVCDASDNFLYSFTSDETFNFSITGIVNEGSYLCVRASDTAGNTTYLLSGSTFNVEYYPGPPGTSTEDQAHSDPLEMERAWQASRVRIPDGQGGSLTSSIAALESGVLPGAEEYPVVVFLHGCSGFSSGTNLRMDLLASEGFVVVAPLSFARDFYGAPCNSSANVGNLYRPTGEMRQYDAGYAIEKVRPFSWADPENVFLMGHSEGGTATASFDNTGNPAQRVKARIVEGWTCRTGWTEYAGLNAPESEPVLSLLGDRDPWYTIRESGGCGEFMSQTNGSIPVLIDYAPLRTQHSLLQYPEIQSIVGDFLSDQLAI